MMRNGTLHRKVRTGATLLLFLLVLAAIVSAPTALAIAPETFARGPDSNSPQQLLIVADSLKTSDHSQFVRLLNQLGHETSRLTDAQTRYFNFLVAWQVAFSGDYDHAEPMLRTLMKQPDTDDMQYRAAATLINILGISRHYEEAFAILNQSLDDLPSITNREARYSLTTEASQLLSEAGQYDLAIFYGNQLVADYSQGRNACTGYYVTLHAKVLSGRLTTIVPDFQRGIDLCLQAGEGLIADSIRRDVANIDITHGHYEAAIALLQSSYAAVLTYEYPDLTTEYNALLAQAYFANGDAPHAEQYAKAALGSAVKGEFSEPLSLAYDVLYRIAQQQGNLRDALTYHEQYMAMDKGQLNEAEEKMVAYQLVKQQMEAKKEELQVLSKRNEILQLQRALDHKAVETGRLYIALLLTVLVSVGLWIFRLKRSQLRFMRLARRDSLTGIFNRQHFVDEAEQHLRYVAKSSRVASLVLIDLDHFKSINDTYGHVVGDRVLKHVVTICKRYLRSSDVFGRLGGEEFGILLPECDDEQAHQRAEQIRAAINAERSGESLDIAVSASFGIASTVHHGHQLRRLLLAADIALYRAKNNGRNQVVVNQTAHANDYVSPDNPSQFDTDQHSARYADPRV